ncbi:MAG TPA: iron dependent repressor, metal binding and dimerization domain protein [Verrucomicrobiota bacterium]|nr:iron dependent repressor, metal binding and dimerization domain protein [Verrucomicrobiota bacterium]HNU51182.1 iron dependent repressor, metal binding and dimerization domain protein [Verrucomicrobiota bacterium]
MNAGILGILVVAGLAVLLWPRSGLLARARRSRQQAIRARQEDALKHILKCEAASRTATLESLAGALGIPSGAAASLLARLQESGLVSFDEGRLGLLGPGRELAVHIIRAHRLWESYLADQTGVEETEWHRQAERQEHLLTPQDADALSARLGHPTHDPHGDVIPEPRGPLAAESGRSLNGAPLDLPVMITHIEDEPESVYREIAALNLRVGMRVLVSQRSPAGVRFLADGTEHRLSPVLAENVFVVPLPEVNPRDLVEEEFLSGLARGTQATVLGLSPACRGAERRRLLDLGFVPGTIVAHEQVSPAGDPTAYRLRGTVVALRREQANLIRIRTLGSSSA